jgi:hypothetical protein
MLPKSVRLFLLAAVLASESAQGSPRIESSAADGPGRCAGGRIGNAEQAKAFATCRRVAGDLTIERTDLLDLSALSELRSVSGALVVRDNAKLRSLEGLGRLEHAGSLTLHANGLYGTQGLEALLRVETLVITSNPRLISLRGFRNLERVGTLVVSKNSRVCARMGLFPALNRVEKHLTVSSNFGLSSEEVANLSERARGGLP